MVVKNGQTVFDIALQAYGSAEDVFKLIADNPNAFPNGLSTLLVPGTVMQIKSASSQPRIAKLFADQKRQIATGVATNANIELVAATVPDAYIGQTLTATISLKNIGNQSATGNVSFNWAGKQKYTLTVFLLPGQIINITDTVTATADMLGTSILSISGPVTAQVTYKVKGIAEYLQSNCLATNTDFALRLYDDSITLAPGTLTWLGTAALIIDSNKIKTTTPGTAYDIRFADTNGNQYRFPLAEGAGYTVHCVQQAKRAIINNATWTTQNTLHYNLLHGATRLSNGIYVPYNETKQKIYNDL